MASPPIPNPQSPIPRRDPVQQRFTELFGPEFGHGKPFERAPLDEALKALEGPNVNLPPVFHIAGTNGKGSTIAFMRAIAEAAGLKVHAFTKPHLFVLNERFVVRGEIASDELLIEAAERVHRLAPGLTQFDAQVAVALHVFDKHHARLVLLECGMGGQDDSTNVIPWPAASIITPIGLDHQDLLGATLPEIAAHKAGILKRNSPAVIARQTEPVRDVIESAAERIGAPLFQQGVEWEAFAQNGRLIVQTEHRVLDLPLPALQGQHQIDNAGLACAAFLAPGSFTIGDDAFAAGVSNARWVARFQPLTRGALSAPIRAIGGEVWVDAGHNADAAAALARALNDMKARRGGRNVVIVGLRRRKDAAAFVNAIASGADHIIAVPLGEEHAPPQEIARLAGGEAQTAPSLVAAMQNAAQFPAPRVLICGSFLLAAEALAAENA